MQVQGLRISPGPLEELARLMVETYGTQQVTTVHGGSEEVEVASFPAEERDVSEISMEDSATVERVDDTPIALAASGLVQQPASDDESTPIAGTSSAAQLPLALGNSVPSKNAGPAPTTAQVIQDEQSVPDASDTTEEDLPGDPDLMERGGEATTPLPRGDALVQVRCFGDFVVTSGGQEITPYLEEGPSYKAFEILAFLAVHADGAVSKDQLLAAVWPDVAPNHAANRMRVAMVRLRGALGRQIPGLPSEVVRCECDGTCRLEPTLVESDAQQFLSLCQGASKLPLEQEKEVLQQARALYAGDLLVGRGARFYEWVDERNETGLSLRDTFREQYRRATRRLALIFVAEGQAAVAVPLLKGLLRAEPTLEDVVRDLFRCYQQLGDLSSLVREERHLRQALHDAYHDPDDPEEDPQSYQPEPEPNALFLELRRELGRNVATQTARTGLRIVGK